MNKTRHEMLSIALLVIIALLAPAAPVAAADWPVTTGSTIATVISGASSGDTITLAPGTYPWHDIKITGKSLTFRADSANGHGPSDTIIDALRLGRIFNVTDSSSLTIDNLTLRNGTAWDGVSIEGGDTDKGDNGGAVSSAGPVTVASSRILNCRAGAGGAGYGASAMSGQGGQGGAGGNGGAVNTTGPVTITSSQILNCRAGTGGSGGTGIGGSFGGSGGKGGSGGAVYTEGTISITSSAFSGCTAGTGGGGAVGYGNGGPGKGGSGGAVYTKGTVSITSSAFSGCTAGLRGYPSDPLRDAPYDGLGGAVYSGGGLVERSTLLNNNEIGYGLDGTGSFTARDNWWGTGTGPSSKDVNVTVSVPSWLTLGITASPSSVTATGTSVIRANLTFNSAGTDTSASGSIPDETMVHFTATGGTVSAEYAGTKNGVATTTFTPSGTGTATITATVDSQSVSVPVTVTTPVTSTNVTTIAVDPGTATTVYAGIDNKGIYNSTNGGTLWLPATTQPANKHIRALVISPATPSTLYAGTYGGGVNRSINSGADWLPCTNTGLANLNVLSLVADRNGKLYAGTENGVYTSADNCASWTAVNGGLP